MKHLRFAAVLLVAIHSSLVIANDGWGNLCGRFHWTGDLPEEHRLQVTTNQAFFGKSVPDQSLSVDPQSKGISNIVIYLVPKEEGNLRIHPSHQTPNDAKVELKMTKGLFSPRVLLIRTNQTILQNSNDPVGYNVNFQLPKNPRFGKVVPTTNRNEVTFTNEEASPCPITCNIHPWMKGYVLLRSNPYMAKTGVDGRFAICNLPVGQHVFRVWHEKVGLIRNLDAGGTSTDAKGQLTIAIRSGDNRIPDTPLRGDRFARSSNRDITK